MKLSSLFINRPVLAIVLNFVIILFGYVAFQSLGVRDFPAVDPPIITVRTNYTGANADVIESQITKVLENSINGIGGIRTLSSVSADGRSYITVEFNVGTDLEAAANDVRDRVSSAKRNLPIDVMDPVVIKADANSTPIILVTLQSDTRTPADLTDFANNILVPRLQTIAQVSEVALQGDKKYAIRLRLDPFRMAAKGITPQDIKAKFDKESVELPSGIVEGASTELAIKTMGRLHTPDDFNNLIIRESDGKLVRLRDVCDVVEGVENERQIVKRDGIPMIGVTLVPQPGANYIAIADEYYKREAGIKRDLPKDIRMDIGYDITKNIRKSILEVIETIGLAFLLVVIVIFCFLREWRATMIPVLAIPISLIGAFFIMSINGFSINILTLLSIVLATGLVVDDAIVVLENIYQKIEQGCDPKTAGHKGASEIFFAIIATTLAILAVLLPIMLMPGMTGRLFREFAITLAGSVALSAFVSLSLTPMLCTKLLKHHNPHEKSLYTITEPFFTKIIDGYQNLLQSFLKHRPLALVIVVLSLAMIALFFFLLPNELAPLEDRSRMSISVTGAEGASYDYMLNASDELRERIKKSVPEREAIIEQVPGRGGAGANSAAFSLILDDPEKRDRSQMQIANSLSKELKKISAVRTAVSQEQTISTSRAGGLPIQYVIMTSDLDRLKEKLPDFLKEASQDPTFQTVDFNLKFNKPQLRINIDRDRANDLGVSMLDISQTLQLALSGGQYGYIERNGYQYQVIGQFARKDRSEPLDVSTLSIRTRSGDMVQLKNIINLEETSDPPQLYHFNRNMSATVSADLVPGKTIDDGIKAMDRIRSKVLDERYTTALTGPARDFMESSSSLMLTFVLALLLIYLVLAAQFESFRHPLIVMFTVPLALAGGLLSLWYFNQSLNIFSQIGIIMLVGLVAKNGILIVEFTNQRRNAGMELYSALIEASVSRFRPIVMTSLTVMLGTLPIALALGAGAKSRMSLGIVVIGGLLFSLVLSLFVVPVIYSYLGGKIKSEKK